MLARSGNRPWRAPQLDRQLHRAANPFELFPIALKFRMLAQRRAYLTKNSRRMLVRRFSQTIVHPFTFAPRRHNLRAPQISEMP